MNIKKHMDIMVEALHDYRKWFDDDSDKLLEIDSAIKSFKQNSSFKIDKNHNRDFFPITSVCKNDIIEAFKNDGHIKKIVMNLKDHEMTYLASKLSDDYCEQLFWDSLKTIFESRFLKSEEVANDVECTR